MIDHRNNGPRNEREAHARMVHKAMNDEEWNKGLRRVMGGLRITQFKPTQKPRKLNAGLIWVAAFVFAFWAMIYWAINAGTVFTPIAGIAVLAVWGFVALAVWNSR